MNKPSYGEWTRGRTTRICSQVAAMALLLVAGMPMARAQQSTATVESANQLEEVVVTATRRSESLSKVPISISTFGAAEMEARGVKKFEDLIRLTPALNLSQQSATGANRVSIRGISSSAGSEGGTDSGTTSYDPLLKPIPAYNVLNARLGTILRVEPFPEAHKPAFKLWIDLGPLGLKTSSAQITALYSAESLVGRQVVCAADLGSKNIAGFRSEVLTAGFLRAAGAVVLAAIDESVANGTPLT